MGIANPFKGLSKTQLYLVLAGGGIIAGYAEYSHHKRTGSWSPFKTAPVASAAGAAGNDPVTGLPYAEDNADDPLTGETYLAEADQYGSVAAAEAAVSAYGQSTATGSGIPVNPASPASTTSINTPVGTQVYTSNQAWASAVEAGLSAISGSSSYDGTDIGTALGNYLTAQPLDPNQVSLVRTAIAEFGYPPEGSFQIIPAPAQGPSTTTSGSTPNNAAVQLNIPSPGGGWQAVSFPSATAADSFYAALGITPNGTPGSPGFTAFWPPDVPESKTDAALSAAGGTRIGPPGQNGYGIVKY